MAQNTNISVPLRTWTQLTDADATNITFSNRGKTPCFVKATVDATPPTDDNGAVQYNAGHGERNVAIADLFPGLTSPDRLWAYAPVAAIEVQVSHA